MGSKFKTQKTVEDSVECIDRIVKLDKGEEKVTTTPVAPHEAHLYKEIQIHKRKDVIKRKITLKNKTNRKIGNVELVFIETKQVRFKESEPVPTESDSPEHTWKTEILPESAVSIQITLESYTTSIYKIKREKEERKNPIMKK
ncbi:MAG: hypothetical protein GF364_00565 [Candidatus Lokiarchaeota archaeon]|nr:hypothetical protein [Candidatus Lokiarchaeota archaeon]